MIFRALLLVLVLLLVGATLKNPLPLWKGDDTVYEVLTHMGEAPANHHFDYSDDQVRMGEEIVKWGRTRLSNGKWSKRISKHYVCTTCHNLEQEDPDLRISDPEARLDYAIDKGLPFLQGTTFKGIVNRESWYNDDYVKKYGSVLIQRAHKNLREATQLCAIECSQGRPMKPWEIEAVVAYYWSLQWTLKDLDLSEEDYRLLNTPVLDQQQKQERREWLKTFYLQKSPAHFYDAPKDKKKGYEGLTGNPEKGKALYELSCLHCHKAYGVSHYILDNSKMSFQHLFNKIPKNSHMSLYQIIAYGTYAIPGHRPYMPHYTKERLNKQQVEDLRAYIELQVQ